MVDGINAAQKVSDQLAVARVALVEVCPRSQVRRPPGPVDRPGQRVEHDDLVSQRQQPVARVRADEPGSASDEDLHLRRCSRRSASSRYTSRTDAAVRRFVAMRIRTCEPRQGAPEPPNPRRQDRPLETSPRHPTWFARRGSTLGIRSSSQWL